MGTICPAPRLTLRHRERRAAAYHRRRRRIDFDHVLNASGRRRSIAVRRTMTRVARRHVLRFAAAAAAASTVPRLAFALDYPNHAVRLVIGFPPGGPTDIYGRLIAQWLSLRLGQTFVVENKPGAGSTIGISDVVHSPADGYTLALVSSSAAISASFYPHLDFELIRDMAPVCGISLVPMVMVVHPSVPAQTVPEFIAYAKANPGKINMASVGNGTTPHMAGELFKMMAGVDLLHVPYRGAAPALTDLLAGRAQVMFEAMATLVAYIKTDKLRALAVTLPTRSPIFPEVPSIAEFLPGYEAAVWFGIGAPKKTPTEIVTLLNKEINAGLADPTISARLNDLGGSVLTGPPSEFEKHFLGDTEKWAKLIKAANIKPE
jgi:tripartite-type tricarboxylate transporter receptor subunit TctC